MNAVDPVNTTNAADAASTVFADVAQNTPDWHDWRRFQCTASDAPIVMNAAPDYWETRTWNELRERRHAEAMGEPVDPAKIFLERAHGAGHALEPVARDWFSAETGARLAPACASRVVAGVPLAASFDAVDPALRLHAEVKTAAGPKSRINRLVADPAAFDDPVFDYVRWQLVHHHAVLDDAADWRFHVVVAGLDADGKRVFGAVPVDAAELAERTAELVERWRRFLDGEDQERLDAAWRDAARDWLAADDDAKAAKKRLDDAKRRLVALAQADDDPLHLQQGFGVKLSTYARTDVRWKDVAANFGLDEAEIRDKAGKTTTVTTVKRSERTAAAPKADGAASG